MALFQESNLRRIRGESLDRPALEVDLRANNIRVDDGRNDWE
jgi:hypothetical protein